MSFTLESRPPRIAVIGLGYVGLPLAVELAKYFPTIGFDIKQARIAELERGEDRSREVTSAELKAIAALPEPLRYTHDAEPLRACNLFIVTVPTPINDYRQPDLRPLESASRLLGGLIQPGAMVIYESTVYPGATEDVCVPLLEHGSGLIFNQDFFVGYSPERINPGDHERRLTNIKKVTSGSTPEVAAYVDALYGRIVTAGTHLASSIRVAEAAKVIENTQRDVNIALINELALIFNRLGIDTDEVLAAAGSKWNFLPFRPGLVGGHCIGVDPYYLTYKAQSIGYHPEIILAGRRLNDSMGAYVAGEVIKTLCRRAYLGPTTRVLVMGLTFKENCPDLRNTRVVDILTELRDHGIQCDVHDPWASHAEAMSEYGLALVDWPSQPLYDAVILAVAHRDFVDLGVAAVRAVLKPDGLLYDVKHVFPQEAVDGRL